MTFARRGLPNAYNKSGRDVHDLLYHYLQEASIFVVNTAHNDADCMNIDNRRVYFTDNRDLNYLFYPLDKYLFLCTLYFLYENCMYLQDELKAYKIEEYLLKDYNDKANDFFEKFEDHMVSYRKENKPLTIEKQSKQKEKRLTPASVISSSVTVEKRRKNVLTPLGRKYETIAKKAAIKAYKEIPSSYKGDIAYIIYALFDACYLNQTGAKHCLLLLKEWGIQSNSSERNVNIKIRNIRANIKIDSEVKKTVDECFVSLPKE